MNKIVFLLICLDVVWCIPFRITDLRENENTFTKDDESDDESDDDASGKTIDIHDFFETMPDSSDMEVKEDEMEEEQEEDPDRWKR